MSGQRGFALIAILALAALMSAYLIATALNPSAAGLVNAREQRNMNVLRQAKAALIAYAASEQWQRYKLEVADQPGALPCPDGNNDGNSDGICPNALLRIGRLPFRTIGSPDLTDANGERLWYAVSSNFYKSAANIINSDTPGLLTVTGTAPVANVVAIVFAPGPPTKDPVSGQVQDRSAPNINRPASYLEGFSLPFVGAPNYIFTTNELPNDTFNDRLLVITQAELMAAVEPVVAARIERDIKMYIVQNYPNNPSPPPISNSWSGGYPFAVPWGGGPGQPQDSYKGEDPLVTPTPRGLMPITRDLNWVRWDTSSISVTQLPGGTGGYLLGTLTIGAPDCSASTGSQISCRFTYPGGGADRPEIQLQATLLNAGRSFVNAVASGNETVRDNFGSAIGWSITITPNPYSVSNTLQANGNGTVIFQGRLRDATLMGNGAIIDVPAPSYHAVSNSTDPTSGWFIANRWYRQTYYAVSQGFVPGGGGSCTLGGTCLTVNNLSGTTNNKRLILVFAGRALDGSTRPTNNLANYFEGENSTPGDLIFEHRSGPPTTINDRVVVVAP